MNEIRGLMDVAAMTRMLHETIACERDIDAELEQVLAQRGELEGKLLGLEKSAEVLELVRLDAEQMLASVRSTCQLAEHVSGKVRELDLAQSRVSEAVKRIEAILDRTNCIVGVKTALETDDYETAAKCVETFLLRDREFQGSEPETAQEQKRQLLESKQKLENLIRAKFAAAAESEDQEGVERFSRLFAPLGLQDEGLRLLVAYLRRSVGLRARRQFDVLLEAMDAAVRSGYTGLGSSSGMGSSVAQNGGLEASANGLGGGGGAASVAPDFVEGLTSLFREVAVAVESNEELLRSIHREDAVVFAIRELQEECDSRAATIIRKYVDFKRLPRAVKEATAASKAAAAAAGSVLAPVSVASAVLDGGAGASQQPALALREVEMCLEDMVLLSRRSEEYTAFMLAKLRHAEGAGAQLSPRAASSSGGGGGGPFQSGMSARAMLELVHYYVGLEEYFMIENVGKAIRIDEPVLDSFTTSMVDDCFYILQNCARRAVSSASLAAVLAVVGAIAGILNNEFRDALQRRIREPNIATRILAGAAGAGVVVGPVSGQKSASDVAAALNNVDVSSDYALKLRQEIEELCIEMFAAPADREKVKSALNELSEASNTLKQLGQGELEKLATSIAPRLRAALDAVAAANYELSESQYAENEADDPWVQRLALLAEQSLAALQPALTPSNYDALVGLVADLVVRRVEAVVLQKRFNQLGGLQLDRDARALVSHFSAMTPRTMRDKFARLTQVATVLNLETPSEILEYWGENAGPMTWRLTPAEVRRVLALRVDFKPEAVAALRL